MSAILIRHELLRNESIRLTTLMDLNLTLTEKNSIVKAGFYLEPNFNKYVCFSCNYICDTRYGDKDLIKKHMKDFKECWFLLGLDVSIHRDTNIYNNLKGYPLNPNHEWFNREYKEINNLLTCYDFNNPAKANFYNQRSETGNQYLHWIAEPIFIPGGANTIEVFDVEKYILSMRCEERRIKSFRLKNYSFPLDDDDNNMVERFAKNGFFYCLTGTNIQCAFCQVVFGDINKNIDVISFHELASPKCYWVNGDKKCNIPYVIKLPSFNTLVKRNKTKHRPNLRCLVCMNRYINVVHKCGHVSLCVDCESKVSNCVICRHPLESRRKIYFQ